jgi:putative ABC transport system permease protein
VWLALSALGQQKVRTTLTTLGVVIGTLVLILSLSVGQGVKQAIFNEFRRHDHMRKVVVWTGNRPEEKEVPRKELDIKGKVSEERRERLRQAIIQRWNPPRRRKPPRTLTAARVRAIAKLDHVEAIVPQLMRPGRALLGKKAQDVLTTPTLPDTRYYRDRIVAGQFLAPEHPRGIVVSEYLLYRWGVVDDDDVFRALGQKVRLEYRRPRPPVGNLVALLNPGQPRLSAKEQKVLEKTIDKLPAALASLDLEPAEREVLSKLLAGMRPHSKERGPAVVAEDFTIIGVMRDPTKAERLAAWAALDRNIDVVLPIPAAEKMFFRVPLNERQGFPQITVRVDHEDHVKEVQERINAMGLETYSLVEILDQVRFNVLIITFATTFVALVALVVAGLGITNTMLMSVLERTHEIGVMKAVGARDSYVQVLFLVEGTLIGLVGGSLGLLLSWLVSFPGDRVARSLAEKQTPIRLEESLFVFPWWITLGVPLFVSLLTMAAAVYPARRAARINPITALRHE